MPHLTIVAHITATADGIDRVKAELQKLVPVTLEEEGCLQYDLHQDDEDPRHFMFYETWESRDLWQRHMAAPHLAAFGAATEGAVAERVIHEMTRI